MAPELTLALIILTTAAVPAVAALLAMRLAGRWWLPLAVYIPPVTAVVSVVLAVVAAAHSMVLSGHDATVVIATCAGGGVVAVVVGTGLARLVHDLQVGSMRETAERARREEAETARRRLVACISHDLRTPLAGLRAMTEAIEDGVAEDPAAYLRRIRLEVQHLDGMVGDLFEVSRLNAGALQLCPERIALADVIEEAVALAEPLARQRGVRVMAATHESLPVVVDVRAITRAIGNLLVNAIRHTPQAQTVQIRASRSRDGCGVVSVADHCGGIPDADLEHVFDLGWQGDAARSPGTGSGAGLGLAIVRGITEAHGGLVRVRNVDQGCRFELRVPLAADRRAERYSR